MLLHLNYISTLPDEKKNKKKRQHTNSLLFTAVRSVKEFVCNSCRKLFNVPVFPLLSTSFLIENFLSNFPAENRIHPDRFSSYLHKLAFNFNMYSMK